MTKRNRYTNEETKRDDNELLNKLMSIDVNNLAQIQHQELTKFVANRLKLIAKLIEQGEYDQIEEYLVASPAGDGTGLDNDYIDFSWKDDEHQDMFQTLEMLRSLRENFSTGDFDK